MSRLRNRKDMRQIEDLSLSMRFAGDCLLDLFMSLKAHDCVDETDATTNLQVVPRLQRVLGVFKGIFKNVHE